MNQDAGKPASNEAQRETKNVDSLPADHLKSLESVTEQPDRSTGKNHSAEKQASGWPSRIEAGCAVLLVIITGCYTYYAGKQLTVMQGQLRVLEASNKPYVGIAAVVPIYNERIKATEVLATISNFGTTPAFELSVIWSGTINGRPTSQQDGGQEPLILFPKRSLALKARIGKDDWEKIDSGQDQFILRAKISYRSREDGPLIDYCEQNEYHALGKAFFPEGCPK